MRRVGPLLIISLVAGTAGCATFPGFEAYRKTASSRHAARTDGMLRRAPPPREQVVVVDGWPYLFTRSQIRRLRRAGYRFDAHNLKAARHLQAGGFTAADLVQAVEDLQSYAGGKRGDLARIAAYRLAGFDLKRYVEYRKSKRSLTGFYNEELLGGIRVWKAGLGLTIIGLALIAATGAALISIAVSEARCTDAIACDGLGAYLGAIIAGSAMGIGGITATIGGIMLGVTSSKVRHRIDAGALDKADARTLRDFRRWRQLAKGKGSGTSLSLSPLFTRGGGGLSLRLKF